MREDVGVGSFFARGGKGFLRCGWMDGWVYVRVFFFVLLFFWIRVWEDGTVRCLRRGKEKIEKKHMMVQNPPIIKDGVKEGGKRNWCANMRVGGHGRSCQLVAGNK